MRKTVTVWDTVCLTAGLTVMGIGVVDWLVNTDIFGFPIAVIGAILFAARNAA